MTLYDIVVAQVLLTREDVDDRKRYITVRDTFESLIQRNIVPVVNENDAPWPPTRSRWG